MHVNFLSLLDHKAFYKYIYVNEAAKLIQHVGRRGGSKYKIRDAWASFAQHRWYPVLDTGHITA